MLPLPFTSLIIFHTRYEKFDLSTYVLLNNGLFSLILMPWNIDLMTVLQYIKSTFRKGSRYNQHTAIFFAIVNFEVNSIFPH